MKKRVLLTINNLDTAGMKHVLAAIAFGLDKNFFIPVVVVNNKSGSALEQLLQQNFQVKELMLRSNGIGNMFFGCRKKVRELKSSGDIAHSFDYSSDWFEAMLMKLAGIPYIAEKTNLSFDSYRWKIKLGLAKNIVCLSNAQVKLLHRYNKKLSLIPTGIDIKRFAGEKALPRQTLGLSDDDIVLISVAHLVPVKGYEELIDAISILKDEYSNIKILMVGKGDPEYEKLLRARMEEKNVMDRFVFAGNSDDVPRLLKLADGKILATQNRGRREAFGAALVEAMAAGLPVIATRSGGPEDIVEDEVTGWLVEGNGDGPLVEGIHRFMQAKSRWKLVGQKGFERASELYSQEKMVKSYEALYKKISGI